MSEMKKYLDSEGLKFLWQKISMEDYPNNDTLIAVINAIDQNKQDKITGTLNQIASFDINGNLVSKDLDNSLSKEGAPADAKAVGDALNEKQPIGDYVLKSELLIDYDELAFDTSEIVFASNTSPILGQAILGQMVLA